MELRHLRSFLAVADELHFRRAARGLGLTQPALSRHIAELERALGSALFARHPRRVELTDAGRHFAERVRRIVRDLDEATDEARQIAQTTQRLRIGYLEYLNLPFVGSLLRELEERHPEIAIERRNMAPEDVLAGVGDHSLDVGFVHLPIKQPQLAFRPVVEGRWHVVLPERHPLAAREAIPVAELASQPLVLFDRPLNPPLYDSLVARCEAAGFSPRVVYATTQVHVAIDLVVQEIGLFIAGSYVFRNLPSGIVSRPLEASERLRLGAVWRADERRHAITSFLEVLRDLVPRPTSQA
jgi:DNA-binding transcriptional LysR family regulator